MNPTIPIPLISGAIDERPRVDVSACLDGFCVWLFGRPYRSFTSLTNASRCASALRTLDALGALPVKETV